MSYRKKYRGLGVTLGALLYVTSGAFAASPATDWKTECVGRFQVNVPGEVDVALTVDRALSEWVAEPIRFLDGSVAAYSKFRYLGSIGITKINPLSSFQKLKADEEADQSRIRKELHGSKLESERIRAASYKELKLSATNTFGSQGMAQSGDIGMDIYLYLADRIVHVESNGYETSSDVEKTADIFVKNFHPRSLFDIPKSEGICIPYGFIADDGKPGRDIGVTMRLKDHPEVEIFFEDQTAPQPYKEGGHLADSEHLNAGFWEIKSRRTKRIEVLFPGYRSIQLDGRTGTASFAEITQKDGSKDYGFVAAVAGDYTAKTDTPELMLYVIRTASRAKGTTISKSELKDMAYKIAASIKRKDVK